METKQMVNEIKNVSKLLDKITEKIEPNNKANLKLYIKDLKRQITFKSLAEMVKNN